MSAAMKDVDRQTVSIEAAGKMLGIGRSVAYALARRDELPVPVIRVGRRMVVSKRALDDLLSAKKQDEDAA